MFQRRSHFGGLSVEAVFAKQTALAAEEEEKSIVQRVTDAMHGKARLDFVFTDQWTANGYDSAWLTTELSVYLHNNHSEVSAWFPKAPMAANAMLLIMSEHWASPSEANSTPDVKMTDWAVLCIANTLVGKGKEEALMKFIGRLYPHSPKQAAMALHEAQRVTIDFYREHVGEDTLPWSIAEEINYWIPPEQTQEDRLNPVSYLTKIQIQKERYGDVLTFLQKKHAPQQQRKLEDELLILQKQQEQRRLRRKKE